jgi:hypothetical protein
MGVSAYGRSGVSAYGRKGVWKPIEPINSNATSETRKSDVSIDPVRR